MAIQVTTSGTFPKIRLGQHTLCFGYYSFDNAADQYTAGTAGGLDIKAQIRRRFGVANVLAIFFGNGLSDAGVSNTSEATARFNYGPQTTGVDGPVTRDQGKITLYRIGRSSGSPGTAQASEQEITTADSINAGRMDFMAICTEGGSSQDSGPAIVP